MRNSERRVMKPPIEFFERSSCAFHGISAISGRALTESPGRHRRKCDLILPDTASGSGSGGALSIRVAALDGAAQLHILTQQPQRCILLEVRQFARDAIRQSMLLSRFVNNWLG
jgi:hypothetical protein